MRGLTINTIHNKNTMSFVTPGYRGDQLKIILVEKEQIFDIFFFGRKMSFSRSRHLILWSLGTLTGQ